MKSFKSAKGKESKSEWSESMMGSKSSSATMSKTEEYGAHQIGDKVTFVAFYPDACNVQIAGDFNNWKPERNPMLRTSEGIWQIKMSLPKGTYKYRFVVDGKWMQDPYNKMSEPNPYGDMNSVITVR